MIGPHAAGCLGAEESPLANTIANEPVRPVTVQQPVSTLPTHQKQIIRHNSELIDVSGSHVVAEVSAITDTRHLRTSASGQSIVVEDWCSTVIDLSGVADSVDLTFDDDWPDF